MKKFLPLLALLLLAGCAPLEQVARNSIAAFDGALVSAESKHASECSLNPALSQCAVLKKAVAAKHAAISALEVYCGFSPNSPLESPCKPVQGASEGLRSALVNMNQILADVKGLAK